METLDDHAVVPDPPRECHVGVRVRLHDPCCYHPFFKNLSWTVLVSSLVPINANDGRENDVGSAGTNECVGEVGALEEGSSTL